MAYSTIFLTYILPGMILLAGVVDDLRSKKIHNWLILVLLTVTTFSVLLLQVVQGIFPL